VRLIDNSSYDGYAGARFGDVELPVPGFALPLQSERHWSDMLAVLIATDPVPLGAVLGRRYAPAGLSVRREAFDYRRTMAPPEASNWGPDPSAAVTAGFDADRGVRRKVMLDNLPAER
jgi:hypothetical protein